MNGIPVLQVEKVSPVRVRPSWVRWRIVALLMAYVTVCHFNRISMSVAGTEQIMPRYGIDETVMGLVYSAYLLLYTLCMTPGGWFIDRFGTRAALMVVGFGSAVFVALTGVTGMLLVSGTALVAGLLVVRGVLGVVSAPIHPAGARAVGFWMPPAARSTANGLVVGAFALGSASAFVVFGELSDWFGWKGAFVVAGAATALLAVLWSSYASNTPGQHQGVNEAERKLIAGEEEERRRRFLEAADEAAVGRQTTEPQTEIIALQTGFTVPGSEETGETDQRDPTLSLQPLDLHAGSGSFLRHRSLMLLTLSYAAVNYVEYLFFYWSQHYYKEVVGLDVATSRLYATVLTLAMGVGTFAGGWLADRAIPRFGRRRGLTLVPVAGMVVCTFMLGLGLLSAESILLSVACFAVAMAAVGASEGPFWTSAVELGRRRGGTAAGILNTGGNAGGLLAPVVTPLFSHFFGWQASLWLAALVCLLGASLWFWINPAVPADEVM